jgi:hypothetical protein
MVVSWWCGVERKEKALSSGLGLGWVSSSAARRAWHLIEPYLRGRMLPDAPIFFERFHCLW